MFFGFVDLALSLAELDLPESWLQRYLNDNAAHSEHLACE
jgi:hypothetical protein